MSHSCPLCFYLPPTLLQQDSGYSQWPVAAFQENLTWDFVDLQALEPQIPETDFRMGNHTPQSHPLGTSWAPMAYSGVL